MRVIAGSAKGRKLQTLEGMDVRPTTDKVKEAIFSSIQFDLYDAAVLDLFAGSGQMGIEALSRGAQKAVFVDMSAKSLQVTRSNLAAVQMQEQAMCYQADGRDFLKTDRNRYHIVILDPPYGKGLIEEVLPLLSDRVVAGGKVICEHETELSLPEQVGTLRIKKKYRYGKIHVTVYINQEEDVQDE
ncbi:MAG: 16S rRNA (guanine(966)-N(2))-methyltransferase RsmD [Ruminococcus sp.]|nr:16S rRNA (guanine(966)-N(2))-methyltransferase RsmD [Ruminococcus sp.]